MTEAYDTPDRKPPFEAGEVVDITIKGARVRSVVATEEGFLFLDFTHGDINSTTQVYMGDSGVSVERVAPADWPPQPGDLWRDGSGRLHFGAAYAPDYDDTDDSEGINCDGWRVVLLSQDHDESCRPGSSMFRPENVNQQHGPLVRVYREGGGGQ